MSRSGADPALVREVLRDVLAEMLPELVAETRAAHPAPAVFPPSPVAAVHRPSTWHGPAPAATDAHEHVSLSNDADLDAFVHRLLHLFEDPAERAAMRSGRRRFVLAGGEGAGPKNAAVRRIERGAVTERIVREAAAGGSDLVLGPRAVLTPMARDVARSLGVQIEKEKRC